MAAEEEMCDQNIAETPVFKTDVVMQEKKAVRGISVSITLENSPQEENNSIYALDLSMCSSSWKVYRDLPSFLELNQRLTASDMIYSPLSQNMEITVKSLESFLQSLLSDNHDRIWYCPYIMAFIDDQKASQIKVIQVECLTKQFCEVSKDASTALPKLLDAWRIIATLAQRVKILETSHQRIHNSFKPKEEGSITPIEGPLLAGIYRYDDIMSQASEILKDESDWVLGEDGGFASAISVEIIPVVIPDPPPIIHTYLSCVLLPNELIPCNVEEDARDEAIGSVITLLEPHQAQVSYRNSVRAFVARVVRRTLSAKVYETGLHALDCFLPDDPIRLTVLLGRTNLFIDNWMTTLTDKLSILADSGSDNGKNLLSEMMLVVDDDCMAGEDVQPLCEHAVSRVTSTNANSSPKLFCDIEDANVEIDSNNLSGVRFLSFLEEVAQLVGKKDLFKRSLLLIRGWWTYEISTFLNQSSKNFLSDHALCVLICSIFNQHHATLFQPLQVLSVFIAEYCELDWSNCAVTVQGVVPFRSSLSDSEIALSDMDASGNAWGGIPAVAESNSEPWLKYPSATDLLTAAIILKYADILKPPKGFSPVPSCGSKSPILSHGSSMSNLYALPTVQPSVAPVSHVSPLSSYREFDPSGVSLSLPVSGVTSSETVSVSTYSPKSESASQGPYSVIMKPSADTDTPGSPSLRSGHTPSDTFHRCAINIVHPLNQTNMVSPSMTSERAAKIVQTFEYGAKQLSQALKISQADDPSSQSPFNRFFKAVFVRFNGGWRPDVFKGAQSMCQYSGAENPSAEWNAPQAFNADSLKASKMKSLSQPDTIWNQVCYMDLVLTGSVSESAVLALSKEILFERGTLPVGEIGKVLQELTCASSFLGKLKEKFGGLKKFLERFPDEFMICTDHPFNPHVFVKKALSAEELDMVAKGTVPPHLTAKYKKAQRNKKSKPPAAGSQSVSPSVTQRTLGPVSNGTSLMMNQGYGGTMPAGTYRSSPIALANHSLASRAATGPGSSSPSGFSQLQHLQQQQNQFYNAGKGHPGQTYSTPGISNRYRASQSQSILRAVASSSGGNSSGNNAYHQPVSPHNAFQSGYSLDGPNPQTRALSNPGSGLPGANSMRENYGAMRNNSLSIGVQDRGSDPYGVERETMFGINGTPRGGSRTMSSPNINGGVHAGTHNSYNNQHPDQSLGPNNNSLSTSERERFSDTGRGLESHLGLFSNAPSPISSQHMSYDNQSLNSSYDSETRFPSHNTVSVNRVSSSSFLRNLESPQVLAHTSSPLLFQSAGGPKSKALAQMEPPSPGSKYGNYQRSGHHDLEQSSPTIPQFNAPQPSPKFDVSKWV